MVGEEQCSFQRGKGCGDQIFALWQLGEKICEKGKSVYMYFVGLEKTYDRVNRKGVWEILKMYETGEHKIAAVKCFYYGSEACVRVDNKESEMLRVNAELRQGCVISISVAV